MEKERGERIRRRAYQIWEAEGHPHGRDRAHWDQAERELGASASTAVEAVETAEEVGGATEKPGEVPTRSEVAGSTPAEAAATSRKLSPQSPPDEKTKRNLPDGNKK